MTGQQLKDHLYKHGIRYNKLADKLNITRTTISYYVKSKSFRRGTEIRILSALEKLGHPLQTTTEKVDSFVERNPVSEREMQQLIRNTDLQRELNAARMLIETQQKLIKLLEEKHP